MHKHQLRIATLFSVMLLAMAFGLLVSKVSAQTGYRTYHNARFNYSISYPFKVLIPQGEAVNGDGQKFLSQDGRRSEEHTSELQSPTNLVCRLLLEKKKKKR